MQFDIETCSRWFEEESDEMPTEQRSEVNKCRTCDSASLPGMHYIIFTRFIKVST